MAAGVKAIVCSRGKGGGCRSVDVPEIRDPLVRRESERPLPPDDGQPRDLFGRTEAELVADISWWERTYKVGSVYTGNEGLAINLARRRANLDIARNELKRLRGERVEETRLLSGQALDKWRKDIVRLGRAGMGRG